MELVGLFLDNMIEHIIDSEIVKHPWEHQVVDDFFNKHDFEELNRACTKLYSIYEQSTRTRNKINIYDAKIYIGEEAVKIIENLNTQILNNLNKIFLNYTDYRKYDEYYIIPFFQILNPNSSYEHIHVDDVNTTTTIVVYMNPIDSIGTILYTSDIEESYIETIEWKQNRGIIFCNIDNKTWHNYKTENSPRITLNFFIKKYENTEKIQKLKEIIEQKSLYRNTTNAGIN
jgi:hypothetical protein